MNEFVRFVWLRTPVIWGVALILGVGSAIRIFFPMEEIHPTLYLIQAAVFLNVAVQNIWAQRDRTRNPYCGVSGYHRDDCQGSCC